MRRYKHQAIFALNVLCALLTLGLLALDMIQVEAALTDNQMMLVKVTGAAVAP
jgi:hypothetical protein